MPMKKLHYDNGYAIIVESITEGASEYHVEKSRYRVEVSFKTAVAIKRFAAEVGEKIISKDEKKRLLDSVKLRKIAYTRITLDYDDIPVSQPLWYENTGFHYSFQNYYSDERFDGKVPTTAAGLKEAKKNPDFLEFYKNGQIGSCADGTQFSSYVNSIIKTANVISTR